MDGAGCVSAAKGGAAPICFSAPFVSSPSFGSAYMNSRKASIFAAETRTLYRRELTIADTVRVTVQLVDCDEKRLHLYAKIRNAEEGWVSATCETLTLHLDMSTRKVSSLPGRHPDQSVGGEGCPQPAAPPVRAGSVIGFGGCRRRAGRVGDDTRQ